MNRLSVKKIISFLILPVLAVTSALAVRPLQHSLVNTVETLKTDYLQMGETALRKSIRYGGIGPSIFGTFDIKKIAIADDAAYSPDSGGGGVPDITIKRLCIKFSFWKLIAGDIPQAVRSIKIVSPSLDFKTQKELLEFFKESLRGDGDSKEDTTPPR